MSEAIEKTTAKPGESPLRSVGFRWLMLFRICTLLSYQVAAVTGVMGLAQRRDDIDRPYTPGTVPA